MKCLPAIFLPVLLLTHAVRADDPVPPELQNVGIDEHLGAQLPLDVQLMDERGRSVTLGDCIIPGKPVVLQLSYFACPMLCDTISQGLLRSMQELDLDAGRDFTVIDVSFDPRDTSLEASEKKKTYLKQYERTGAGDGWRFLVGQAPAIKSISETVGYKYKWIESSQQFSHPAVLMLLSPDGKVMRYLYGVEFPRQTLRLSLVEASEGKIGTTLDRVLMICFHYTPSEGRYTLAALNLMRFGAIVTVIVLASILTRQFLKERRQATA